MKRGRNSTASTAKRRRNNGGKVSYKGPSFSHLPSNVLVSILLRLTIKRIFVCKCVCKSWYGLVSDPEFAKIHFDQAQVYPLVRTSGFDILSRMLYLVQSEQDDLDRTRQMKYYKIESPIKFKLDMKLKLPLRNIETILDKEGAESKHCLKLNMKNHKYNIVNSCNGLLCLSNPSDNDPVIVCNPVTGEFIYLPEARTANDLDLPIECGFGFSPVTNQYKVIRMFIRWADRNRLMVAEVHVLGTDTWKDLCYFPESRSKLFPTYLNGCVYWVSPGNNCSVISFDVGKECFELISAPSGIGGNGGNDLVEIGVLGGELFISDAFGYDILDFWVMKDNGIEKSWSHIFYFTPSDDDRWPYGSYKPIKYLNNGALFLFHSHKHAFICKLPEKNGFRYLKLRGFGSKVEAIPHIPSFVSLKLALSGHDVEVLNVNSRCAELKLHREGKDISIVEEDRNDELDTSEDMYQDYDSEDREKECVSEAWDV